MHMYPNTLKLQNAILSEKRWVESREELIMSSSALFAESRQSKATLDIWRKDFLGATSDAANEIMDKY